MENGWGKGSCAISFNLIFRLKFNIQWTLVSKVKAHGKALTSLSTLGDTVVSGSSDSTVKVWEVAVSG